MLFVVNCIDGTIVFGDCALSSSAEGIRDESSSDEFHLFICFKGNKSKL